MPFLFFKFIKLRLFFDQPDKNHKPYNSLYFLKITYFSSKNYNFYSK